MVKLAGLLTSLAAALVLDARSTEPPRQQVAQSGDRTARPRGHLEPGHFEPSPVRGRATARTSQYALEISTDGITLYLADKSVIHILAEGRNPNARLELINRKEGVSHYFHGHNGSGWRTNVPHFDQVAVHEIYPGVDWEFRAVSGKVEFAFRVAPGVDPSTIRLASSGSERSRIEPTGAWSLETTGGMVTLSPPIGLQGSSRVAASFVQRSGQMSFRLGRWDPSKPLLIDPTIDFTTYYGGANSDDGFRLAQDREGNLYLTGATLSPDFQGLAASNRNWSGGRDAYLLKLSPDGSRILYGTYLGGAADDAGSAVAVDSDGSVYVAGSTLSFDYPTVSASDSSANGGGDVFVTKLNAAGSAILYSSYLGGSQVDLATGIAVASGGSLLVAGSTESADFPTTTGANSRSHRGGREAFVASISANGTSLAASTFLGGSGYDEAWAVAFDPAGIVWVAGSTSSADFPVRNSQRPTPASLDLFLTRMDTALTSVMSSSLFGGTGFDRCWSLSLSQDSIILAGYTDSVDFPTVNAFDSTHNGKFDAFVMQLDASGSRIVMSTFFGGSEDDFATAVRRDREGSLYMVGFTQSVDMAEIDPLPTGRSTGVDGFAVKFSRETSTLDYSTYLGSSGDDYMQDLVFGAAGSIFVAGWTNFGDFPGSAGFAYRGENDIVLLRLRDFSPPPEMRLTAPVGRFETYPDVDPPAQTTRLTTGSRSLRFDILSAAPWLQVTADSNVTPSTLTFSIRAAFLSPGDYSGAVRISASGAANPNLDLTVSLLVADPRRPRLILSQGSLAIRATSGGTQVSDSIRIDSSGQPVSFSTTSSVSWLQLTTASAVTPSSLTIAVNPTSLAPGSYTGSVRITSPAAGNSPQVLPVNLTVTSQGTVRLTSDAAEGLAFRFRLGRPRPDTQAIRVFSEGSPTAVTANAVVRTPAGRSWLRIDPRTSSTPAIFAVTIDPTGLATEGVFEGSILFSSGDARLTVPVRLEVSRAAPARLETDRQEIILSAVQSGRAESASLAVFNRGPEFLNFAVEARSEGGGSWLSASPEAGGADEGLTEVVVVRADPGSLAPGAYRGSVRLRAEGAADLTVDVVLLVQRTPNRVLLSESAVSFSLEQGQSDGRFTIPVELLASGPEPVKWRATTETFSGTGWLTVSPSEGVSDPSGGDLSKLDVRVSPVGLSPGEYYAMLRVETGDEPAQQMLVVLQVAPAGLGRAPSLSQTGIAFAGDQPQPRRVRMYSPGAGPGQRWTASVVQDSGLPNWLQIPVSGGTLSVGGTAEIEVRVNSAGLPPGEYRGTVAILFPGGQSRNLAVLYYRPPLPGSTVSLRNTNLALTGNRTADGSCAATRFYPLITSLEPVFFLAGGLPASTELVVVDDCGQLVSSGAVGGLFSNRDRQLDLSPVGDGRWRATWVPRIGAESEAAFLSIVASDPTRQIRPTQTLPVAAVFRGSLGSPRLSATSPILSPTGSPTPPVVAPGSQIRLRGSQLADRSVVATPGTRPSFLDNTQVLLGDVPLELLSVSPQEIVGLVPERISTLSAQPMVVRRGDRIGVPETILVAERWPVLASEIRRPEAGVLEFEVTGLGRSGEISVQLDGRPAVSLRPQQLEPGIWRVRLAGTGLNIQIR